MYNMQMRMQRIIVIAYHTCPLSDERNAEIGGMNTYVLELSKALAETGYIIDIYTRCVDKNSPKIVQVLTNLRVIHLIAGNPVSIPKKDLFEHIPEFLTNLYDFMEQEKISYDIISAHYFLSGQIGFKLKKRIKVPLIVTFHTLALMKNLVTRNEDEKEGLQRIKTELLLTKQADKIIATSGSDLEYIHTLYNCPLKKIALLSPGVNLRLFRPINQIKAKKFIKANVNQKLILFVGRIDPVKGIDVLLYTIKILVQKHSYPAIALWIVGGDNIDYRKEWSKELKYLEEIRQLLGITAYVKFIGKQVREKLPYYYNAAEIVLMPSQYESFGQAALEAMACGTPIIITDTTGVSGLLDKEHNALLISANNPIGLAKKIRHLLTDTNEYKKMSHEVFKKVQNLSWENVALKFTQIVSK